MIAMQVQALEWYFCKELNELRYLTKCIALKFEISEHSSCYFSEL